MTPKEEYEKSINILINNPNVSAETKQLAGLNYLASEILFQLEHINKNLEKIANKDFIQIGDLKTTVNNVGNYLEKEDFKKQLDTIICNKNKDSHVDKNITLD